MKNQLWICAMAVGVVGASPARGETWADWLVPPANAPLAAEFQPGWAVEPLIPGKYTRVQEVLTPNRGYEGQLVFSPAPGGAAVSGPLKVRLLYSVAHPEEMNWPEGDGIPANFVPQVLPQAVPRRTSAESTWSLPAEFPLRVPVVLPRSCDSQGDWCNNKPSALFGRYEVVDAAGRVLCRGILPARALSENVRSLVGMVADDEAMKRLTEKSGSIERVSDLPDELAAYRAVRGIWFTEPLWQKLAGREALLRRLLLSGVRLSGETALVERIQAALGTGRDGQAVSEAAVPSSWKSGSEFSLRSLNLWEVTPKDPKRIREKSVFGNEADLFGADREAYLIWTLAGLLVFCAGVGTILAVVFLRFKGERRVAIWWALPAWTLVSFGAIWAGGTLLLERRPRADVTEYRLAMAGWPEMYCRAVAAAMTFEPGRPEWTLPPGAMVDAERSSSFDGWWRREDAEFSPAGLRLRLARQLTGDALNLEAGWFEPAAMPVVPEDGTVAAPGRRLVAREAVDGVFALVAGEWRDLGPMQAGDRRDPFAAPKLAFNHLPGLPAALDNDLPIWRKHGPCGRPDHEQPPDVEAPPPEHDWFVVAWRRDVPPRVAPVWKDSLTKGRVIWVLQCP